MARILRGEIRWADLNPVRGREQAGLRPVLILSHEFSMIAPERSSRLCLTVIHNTGLSVDAYVYCPKNWFKIGIKRTLAARTNRATNRRGERARRNRTKSSKDLNEIIGCQCEASFRFQSCALTTSI